MEALFNQENKDGLINLWNFHYFLTVECKYVQVKLTSWLFCWYLYCFRAKLYRLEHNIVSLLLNRQTVVKYLHWYLNEVSLFTGDLRILCNVKYTYNLVVGNNEDIQMLECTWCHKLHNHFYFHNILEITASTYVVALQFCKISCTDQICCDLYYPKRTRIKSEKKRG